MRLSRKKLVAIGATLVVAGAGAVVAYAAWSAHGSGNGTASARSAQAVTVTAAANGSADMYPGGPAGTISFTLSNPNPYALTLTAVSYGTPVSAADLSGCPSTNLTVNGSAPATVSYNLPAGASNVAESIAGVLDLSHSAPDGCQGVSFSVPITLTGTQN
jgi:hypothetical protein